MIEVIGGILLLLFPLFGAFLVAQWFLGNLFPRWSITGDWRGPGPVRCGGSHVGAVVPLCDAVACARLVGGLCPNQPYLELTETKDARGLRSVQNRGPRGVDGCI